MTYVSRITTAAFLAFFASFSPTPPLADEPPPFPIFTFKREKAPLPGEPRRGLVQIKPAEQAAALQPPTISSEDPAPEAGAYDWFWSEVPSDLKALPAQRLQTAFARLEQGPAGQGTVAPRLQQMQDIAQTNGADILLATVGSKVSPALVLAVIAVESDGQSAAESPKGAQGLMQLMPDTASRFGVSDPLSARENIQGGVAYLDWLLAEFDGDAVLALAGYNAGEGAVKRHGGVPPFAETRDYVPRVLAAYSVARGLCQTRPQLITDACALRLAAQ